MEWAKKIRTKAGKLFPKNLFNKYLIAFVIFLIWMIFFDNNRFINQWRLHSMVHDLETERNEYKENIAKIRADKKDIEENKEKFAREKYFMHKENEDVFIFEEQE